MDNIFGSLL